MNTQDLTTVGRRIVPAASVKPRAGAARAAEKRNLSRLSILPSLPRDILYEIFSHVSPGDLLNLSLASKAFRAFLLCSQSKFIWRDVLSAFTEEGYPPCPDGMLDYTWANLIWGKPRCSVPGCYHRAPKILWALRRRICKNCIQKRLTTGGMPVPFKGIPTPATFFLPTVIACTRESHGREMRHMWDEEWYCFQREMNEIREECADPEDYERRCDEYLSRRVERKEAVHRHAEECAKLEAARAIRRSRELSDLKFQRLDQVRERLSSLGYADEDINHPRICKLKAVRSAKPLTDRGWARIAPFIRPVIDKIRADRLG